MASHGECKTCEHYNNIADYCTKLKQRVGVSRNVYHPGLLMRPVECNHLQHYKVKIEKESNGIWMTGLGYDDD